MEFWGVEVPSGKPLSCDPGKESYVHMSQAALGESKNGRGSERVVLKVASGSIEVVLGTLSQGRCDQITLDLIFNKGFKLSHNSAGSSVYFSGYKTDAFKDLPLSSDEGDEEFSGKGKLAIKGGKSEVLQPKLEARPPAAKVEAPLVEVKPEASKAKPKPKEEDDEDDDDEDDDDDKEDDEDDEMLEDDMESDEEDDESEEEDDESEDEEIKPGKKRPHDGMKTPVPEKKLKVGSPMGAAKPGNEAAADYWRSLILAGQIGQGPGEKKEARTPATPAPALKQQQQSAKKDVSARKTPVKENVSPKPKSGKEGSKVITAASGKKIGQFLCQTCNKNFQSESALTQHNIAKHK